MESGDMFQGENCTKNWEKRKLRSNKLADGELVLMKRGDRCLTLSLERRIQGNSPLRCA